MHKKTLSQKAIEFFDTVKEIYLISSFSPTLRLYESFALFKEAGAFFL